MNGLSKAVVICRGELSDPEFSIYLAGVKEQLQDILHTERETFLVSKLERWNSVRVTFHLPPAAARRLARLAVRRPRCLHSLGISSVQIDEHDVVSVVLNESLLAASSSAATRAVGAPTSAAAYSEAGATSDNHSGSEESRVESGLGSSRGSSETNHANGSASTSGVTDGQHQQQQSANVDPPPASSCAAPKTMGARKRGSASSPAVTNNNGSAAAHNGSSHYSQTAVRSTDTRDAGGGRGDQQPSGGPDVGVSSWSKDSHSPLVVMNPFDQQTTSSCAAPMTSPPAVDASPTLGGAVGASSVCNPVSGMEQMVNNRAHVSSSPLLVNLLRTQPSGHNTTMTQVGYEQAGAHLADSVTVTSSSAYLMSPYGGGLNHHHEQPLHPSAYGGSPLPPLPPPAHHQYYPHMVSPPHHYAPPPQQSPHMMAHVDDPSAGPPPKKRKKLTKKQQKLLQQAEMAQQQQAQMARSSGGYVQQHSTPQQTAFFVQQQQPYPGSAGPPPPGAALPSSPSHGYGGQPPPSFVQSYQAQQPWLHQQQQPVQPSHFADSRVRVATMPPTMYSSPPVTADRRSASSEVSVTSLTDAALPTSDFLSAPADDDDASKAVNEAHIQNSIDAVLRQVATAAPASASPTRHAAVMTQATIRKRLNGGGPFPSGQSHDGESPVANHSGGVEAVFAASPETSGGGGLSYSRLPGGSVDSQAFLNDIHHLAAGGDGQTRISAAAQQATASWHHGGDIVDGDRFGPRDGGDGAGAVVVAPTGPLRGTSSVFSVNATEPQQQRPRTSDQKDQMQTAADVSATALLSRNANSADPLLNQMRVKQQANASSTALTTAATAQSLSGGHARAGYTNGALSSSSVLHQPLRLNGSDALLWEEDERRRRVNGSADSSFIHSSAANCRISSSSNSTQELVGRHSLAERRCVSSPDGSLLSTHADTQQQAASFSSSKRKENAD